MLDSELYKKETLPSGIHCLSDRTDDLFKISFNGHIVYLTKLDIARLHGIAYPTKVHGKWKGHCGEGPINGLIHGPIVCLTGEGSAKREEYIIPGSAFEQAIAETAKGTSNNNNYSPDTL